jgi:AcrR family transcriptional regulator
MPGRRSVADAQDTKAAILRRAADIASVDGLEAVSIGRLAAELNMSKAGVLGHFGTKEVLQLETVDLASHIFQHRVWDPVTERTPGLDRLLGLCDTWIAYAAKPPFPGGCFMATSSFEFASRQGRVHDAIAKAVGRWHSTLVREIERAMGDGDLDPAIQSEVLAFSLEALAAGVKPARYLRGDSQAPDRARQAMHIALGQRY